MSIWHFSNPSSSPTQQCCLVLVLCFFAWNGFGLGFDPCPTFWSGISTAVRVPEGSVVASQP